MKKSIIASVVALGLVSGLAQAADKEVQFVGSVTNVTCDIEPSVDGSNSMIPGLIQLGTVAAGVKGQPVNFTFKPAKDQQNITACDTMQDTGTAKLTWTSSNFTAKGLTAISGAATDAAVEISPTNAKAGNGTMITASATSHDFDPTLLKTGGAGLKYQAILAGGTQVGDMHTAAKFNFSYK
ncbi:TPA_asm: fimbrial protein [Salmonella enterica subsp. enterica serovar Typhimurium str. SL1344]|uniref:Fimbrial protein n=1 Tax=Salmonella typhimurium (strain SL1344) TaxID=216597 RepID=A0A718Y5J6_SALTS|nr:fimbrial protein [Salmonella enterica subsp. enterica serovar Typhimurium str. SL1344]